MPQSYHALKSSTSCSSTHQYARSTSGEQRQLRDNQPQPHREGYILEYFHPPPPSPPFLLSFACPLIEILTSPLVKMAGQLSQIIAIFILVSQTPAIVLVFGCFGFLFGVLEGGISFWRAPLRL